MIHPERVDPSRLYTIFDIATSLEVSASNVEKWIKSGILRRFDDGSSILIYGQWVYDMVLQESNYCRGNSEKNLDDLPRRRDREGEREVASERADKEGCPSNRTVGSDKGQESAEQSAQRLLDELPLDAEDKQLLASKEWLTVREADDISSSIYCDRTLRKMCQDGKLYSRRNKLGHWQISTSSFVIVINHESEDPRANCQTPVEN